MKTSNKLLLTAILIIVVSMVTYDLALRAEYRKGTYKSRFYGMDKTSVLSGFTTINNRAANLISIQVEQGSDQGVWVKSEWKDRIKISRNGMALVIEAADKQATHLSPYQNSITIICPSLEKVITSPFVAAKGGEEGNYSHGSIFIKGFNLENLDLKIAKSIDIYLENNKINSLKAIVGDDKSRDARLDISSNNHFNYAEITVAGMNQLQIQSPVIDKSNFNISDSAQLFLSKSSLKMFQNR